MIHVCFGLHDETERYSKFTGTAMLSIFENTNSKITVHILHDNTLTQDNHDKFVYLAGQYGQYVNFYNVEELCADRIETIYKAFPKIDKTRFSIAMCYRFFIQIVLPTEIEKAIYLDSDIIVNLNINELWKIELDNNILGAITSKDMGVTKFNDKIVHDGYVKIEDYFNSGVLLMNLTLLRREEETLLNGIKFAVENKYFKFFDQSILNYCFATRTLKLLPKFNVYFWIARNKDETFAGQKIYHYTGGLRCQLNMNNPLNRMWLSYFMKTPWFDKDSIGRLYKGFLNIRNDLKISMANLSAIMSGKTRAFFVNPDKIESMKEFFAIRDDELIIPSENEDSLQKLIDAMKDSQGKCVFFIMTKKFIDKNFPFKLLIKEGFVLDKDFVKGWQFLSETHGNKFNSYPLIQAM